MGIPNLMQLGQSGMAAAQASISTTGHNIVNANSEGYTRQRVLQSAQQPREGAGSRALVGQGVEVSRIERVNDKYLDKQLREGQMTKGNLEEKDLSYRGIEEIFNEMNGEGLNRLMARFFNEFRKLANDPGSEAVRLSVKEATQSLISDFRRVRNEVNRIKDHIDSRIESYVVRTNSLTDELANLNAKVKKYVHGGSPPNDLLDRREAIMSELNGLLNISEHEDEEGGSNIDIKGIGPLVTGGRAERLRVERSPADDQGKPEGSYDILSSSYAGANITHVIEGGRLGALLEVRDNAISPILEKLDTLAFAVSKSVNAIHQQGITQNGQRGVNFFKDLKSVDRAAEFFSLSDQVRDSANNIATAAAPNSPGDNRIAVAISGLQGQKLMEGGHATVDDYYNSIISSVGVKAARTREDLSQHEHVVNQLKKFRDQISGVSIDEETANLLQFQHTFDASAKVISVADEMLKTILSIKT